MVLAHAMVLDRMCYGVSPCYCVSPCYGISPLLGGTYVTRPERLKGAKGKVKIKQARSTYDTLQA